MGRLRGEICGSLQDRRDQISTANPARNCYRKPTAHRTRVDSHEGKYPALLEAHALGSEKPAEEDEHI